MKDIIIKISRKETLSVKTENCWKDKNYGQCF